MQATASIIDLTCYRKRRDARRNAELMWNMYAARAGLAGWTLLHAQNEQHIGKARP